MTTWQEHTDDSLIGYETANGKLGPRILIPVGRVGAPQKK